MMKVLGLIPARYASSRFPGKPLADIAGKTMIQRVYEGVAPALDEVCVATDDERIFQAVQAFGGRVVMTSGQHRSGTDRCAEAVRLLNSDADVIINIQGDEPLVGTTQIEDLKSCFPGTSESGLTQIATLVKAFRPEDGWEALSNPNSPKVLVNPQSEALYFSRSVVPYLRNVPQEQWLEHHTFYKHIGIYAYRRDILCELASLPQSPLEQMESLEQLRWIENGYRIRVAETQVENLAVDTPEDLERIRQRLSVEN